MAGRTQQDAFMEDSEDTCPLCVEEFDLSDKNFRPCPCGYQICQFCYNNIKNNMNGLCPACRRPYDDKNIEWKIVSPEEFKADIANQARKKAAARQKEAERKQVESSHRKHLQGLRVVQRNLVYITGMSSEGVPDDQLEEQLKGNTVFGQYGRIIKLSANKLKDTGSGNATLAIFITFADEEAAGRCIAALDGRVHQGRILKAQHGTTKYCSAFLRNEICNNRNCTFLHETGEDRDSFSRQELSSLNAASSQTRPQHHHTGSTTRPHPPQHSQSQPATTATPSSALGPLKSETMSRSDSGDGPALPSTANWAKNPQLHQSRRSSQAASRATPSPQVANVKLSAINVRPESRASSKFNNTPASVKGVSNDHEPSSTLESLEVVRSAPHSEPRDKHLDESFLRLRNACIKAVSQSTSWTLDRSTLDEETLRAVDTYAPLIESNGGLARQELRDRLARSRRIQEEAGNLAQAINITEDDDTRIGGSLQLGGEPDVGEDALEAVRNRVSASGLFGHQTFEGTSITPHAFPPSSLSNELSSLDHMSRSITPHQRASGSLLKNGQDNESVVQQFQRAPSTSQHHSTLSNPFQGQNPALSTHSRHGRQSSRYTFANDSSSATTTVKPTANTQILAQQSAMMPSQNKTYTTQPNIQTGFYSGVQGPPPGLKSSGTPPISGGGMFGQGYGFANAMGGSLNFGSHLPGKPGNENDSILLRARAGASSGGLGPDAGKQSGEGAEDNSIKPEQEKTETNLSGGDAIDVSPSTKIENFTNLQSTASEHPTYPMTKSTDVKDEFPPLTAANATNKRISRSDSRIQIPETVAHGHGSSVTQTSVSVNIKRSEAQASEDRFAEAALQNSPSIVREAQAVADPPSKAVSDQEGRSKMQRNRMEMTQEKAKIDPEDSLKANKSRMVTGQTDTSTDFGGKNLKADNLITNESSVSGSNLEVAAVSTAASATGTVKAPRTIRVVDTPKMEASYKSLPKGLTSGTETSVSNSASGTKETSRRPSLTSVNIPSTSSNDPHSETASYTGSHPDSPAGGKQSGAPVPSRIKTKSQAKKERRARKVEESKLSGSLTPHLSEPAETTHEAIVGRKKKAKREKTGFTTGTITTEPAKLVENRFNVDGGGFQKIVQEGREHDNNQSEEPIHEEDEAETVLDQQEGAKSDQSPNKLLTISERISRIDMTEMLEDMIRAGELDQSTVDLVLNPPSQKMSIPGAISQTTIPRLTAEERRALEQGKPVAIMSVVPHDTDGSVIAKHEYPYSIILPNVERTIIPMASREEAELNVKLYSEIMRDAAVHSAQATASGDLAAAAASPLAALSPLELALSYFSNMQEIYPDESGEMQEPTVPGKGGGVRSMWQGQDSDDELIATSVAAHRWMEDSTREIQAQDIAMGGNHFERARAAALGHGPVRLDPVGDVAHITATPPPPPPLATHPVLGERARNTDGTRGSDGRITVHDSPELWEMFKHHVDIMSEPLKVQNLSEELQSIGLDQAEARLEEASEYVAHLKHEADNADKKMAALVKKSHKLLRPRPKASQKQSA